jgi:hypothetical protein
VTGTVRERARRSRPPQRLPYQRMVAGSPSPVRTTGFLGASPTSWARAS